MSTMQDSTVRLPADLAEVIAEQERIFAERQPESRRMAALAARSLAGGVVSSWQITAPQPVWLSHGRGSKVYDVDGNEYVDLHGGYGVGLAGLAGAAGRAQPRHDQAPAEQEQAEEGGRDGDERRLGALAGNHPQ